mmetsp:Transcript_41342/g.119734  ORF Transcript_41342/g.119734 Transcript_41342/m.119734 type:complete len:90 (-) Transcript_41342:1952-2221(-)
MILGKCLSLLLVNRCRHTSQEVRLMQMVFKFFKANQTVSIVIKLGKQCIGILDLSSFREMKPVQNACSSYELLSSNDSVLLQIQVLEDY